MIMASIYFEIMLYFFFYLGYSIDLLFI